MSLSAADLVAKLAQAGIDPSLLSQVAEALFTGEIESRKLSERRESERENSRRYRTRLGKEIPGWLRRDVFERDGFACVDCGSEERLEVDHITPLTAGGSNDFENLQTLCKACNSRKRDRVRKSDKRGQTRTSPEASEKQGIGT
jgi:5-methylcytosine-specific restriction protein A